MPSKVLVVLTSHSELGNTGKKTGFWLEELAAPYYTFKDAGFHITLASPAGGQPPLDPKSNDPSAQTDATRRFDSDSEAKALLAATQRLADVKESDYDVLFYPGGHGPLWDLANDAHSVALIEAFDRAKKPHGLVCHAPAVLKDVKKPDGTPFVAGRKVTGFTNEEEDAVQLTAVVPFLLEDVLQEKGAIFSRVASWHPYAVKDGLLVTGQNPASSERVAEELIALTK